ncbi:hypothetical protein [Actinomadura madurae]|nr:hypothetical protein [Actinomadura madurae]
MPSDTSIVASGSPSKVQTPTMFVRCAMAMRDESADHWIVRA